MKLDDLVIHVFGVDTHKETHTGHGHRRHGRHGADRRGWREPRRL